ncbi:hypothetical protein CEG41_03055 [Ureaplasma parvum]|nr:hypothetical protein CEG41_03055 [Ureaplasma parvum]
MFFFSFSKRSIVKLSKIQGSFACFKIFIKLGLLLIYWKNFKFIIFTSCRTLIVCVNRRLACLLSQTFLVKYSPISGF